MSYGPLTKSHKAELAERPNGMETPDYKYILCECRHSLRCEKQWEANAGSTGISSHEEPYTGQGCLNEVGLAPSTLKPFPFQSEFLRQLIEDKTLLGKDTTLLLENLSIFPQVVSYVKVLYLLIIMF